MSKFQEYTLKLSREQAVVLLNVYQTFIYGLISLKNETKPHKDSRFLEDGTEYFPAFFIDISRKKVRICFKKKTIPEDLFDIYELTHISLYSIGQVISELKLFFKI